MTASLLLACILVALLLQVAAGLAWALLTRNPAEVDSAGTVPQQDTTVSNGAWSGLRDFRVVRREYEDAAATQCSFYLEPVDSAVLLPYKPGQYLTFALKVPDGAAGERSLTRCYSLSDRPAPDAYRVTIKRALPPPDHPELPPGAASNHFHDRVQPGDLLQLRAPSGHFHIDPDAGMPAVFIAGGIGITPMMSMLRWCVAEQPERRVHLYYGVRSGADHAFKSVLEHLARTHGTFELNVVYSNPGPNDAAGRDYQHDGRIDVALLRRTLPHGRHQFYVCGPAPMMQSLVPALQEWGVPAEDLHFEAFGPSTVRLSGAVTNEPTRSSAAAFDVRFGRSGRTLVWDGQDANLLDFAERHGLPVDSGCRTGSCGACQTRVLSGNVSYTQTPDHEVANGHCLLCVGTPRSALVLDA